jgi:hypothetical protein
VTNSRFSALSTAYLQLAAIPHETAAGCLLPGGHPEGSTRTAFEDPAPFRHATPGTGRQVRQKANTVRTFFPNGRLTGTSINSVLTRLMQAPGELRRATRNLGQDFRKSFRTPVPDPPERSRNSCVADRRRRSAENQDAGDRLATSILRPGPMVEVIETFLT